MAVYITPTISVYRKRPFLSIQNNKFYARFSFQCILDLLDFSPANTQYNIWNSVNLNKRHIRINEISTTAASYVYIQEQPFTANIIFSYISGTCEPLYIPTFHIGIGSQDCTLVPIPTPADITPFYGCNYITYESFSHNYSIQRPDSLHIFKTQQNFVNCGLTYKTFGPDCAGHDVTNYVLTMSALYTNYVANPVVSTVKRLITLFFIHVHGEFY